MSIFFFFSSRRRHTRLVSDWSSDVCSSDLEKIIVGTTNRYLVDDLNPTGYAQVIEEVVNGAVRRTYTYGTSRINQNQLINSTWTPSFYGYDGMGSVRLLTDSTGTVTDTYDYDAWGSAVNVTGSTPNLYLSQAEHYDSAPALSY